jgi:hypothetical protein
MSRAESFPIDAVAWHTQVQGNPESREHICERFQALSVFLRARGLLSREIVPIGEAFVLHSDDLTDEGLLLMKAAYDKWLKRMSRGADPSDVAPLEKALTKLRGEQRAV